MILTLLCGKSSKLQNLSQLQILFDDFTTIYFKIKNHHSHFSVELSCYVLLRASAQSNALNCGGVSAVLN